jgi:hypothetical protein
MDIKDIMGKAPESLDEAITRALIIIKHHCDDLLVVSDVDDFTTQLHHGLGQHIRNYWGLWSQTSGLYKELSQKYQLSHADDLSNLVLTATYQTHHNLPILLEQTAARCHKHWYDLWKSKQ